MSAPQVKIDLTSPGKASIEVDGADIAPAVREMHLDAGYGRLPVLTVSLVALGATVEGVMRLDLSAGTVGLLARFGWLPPVPMNADGTVTLTRPAGSSGSSSGGAE